MAIRRSFAEDVYIVMPAFDVAQQSASIEVVVNPLVNWVWFGFGVLAIGTVIALLPESTFAFATARLPAEAATATLVVLLLVMAPDMAHAQHVESPQTVPLASRTPLEREVGRAVVCMCGTLRAQARAGVRLRIRRPDARRDRLAREAGQDQTRRSWRTSSRSYGSQEPLAEPIDEGFNRLAWLAPYLAGLLGLGLLGLTARRWTSSPKAATVAPTLDPALDQRLDDELRDLD